ncbi:hypothetical protein QLS71_002155 [Mariniflexile litorale]|uniref:Transporter n=1 Tax=Mariniflexile litorale TaxID=3045158 RepID=A0AAU7EI69_9FLAO|nr:hypothetical protein [Mariniflexile sp. KMM 9835]MDQ8210727.1 hypothetical protein [Mariniflexile sp. KMM 9835]
MMLDFQNINIKTILFGILFLCNPLQNEAKTNPTHNHDPFEFFCDLCGCSTSGGSSSFGTLGNVSFVGVRYMYQNFESKNGIFSNSPTSKEYFNTYQLWGRLPITEVFSLNAIIPYQDLNRVFEASNERRNGLGDASIIGWYKMTFYKKQAEDTEDEEREASGHQLNVGLGVKLPTGAFEESLTNRINPGFQVGTGSVDAIFSLMHTYSKNQLGVNTTATYYLKTENKNEYQFGNQFSYASNVYYNVPFKKSALSPFLGISGDVYNSIKQYNERLADTDGNMVNGTFGSEFKIDKFIVGANYTFPVSQHLFGDNVTSKNKFSLYLNYML